MVSPPHLQRLGHLLLTDFLEPGKVGDRLRQAQRPVVGAAAEALARVEVSKQSGGIGAEREAARRGRGHLGVAAAGTEAMLLSLTGRAASLAHSCRRLSRRPADL